MLGYLTLIFSCQLLGELITVGFGLPIPGPVCGMAILFCGLVLYGSIPTDLAAVGGALLDNLSLLFIPAGVGVMLHVSLLGQEWFPITVALAVSAALTIGVTGLIMSRLAPLRGDRNPAEGAEK